MARYIIAFGRISEMEVIDVRDHETALREATRRSMDEGCLDDELADTTWAEPYSYQLAADLGLFDGAKP